MNFVYKTFFISLLVIIPSVSLAYDYSRSPSGSGSYDSIDFTVDATVCQFNPSNDIDAFSILVWDLDTEQYVESNISSGLSDTVTISGVNANVGAVEIQRYYLGVPSGTCAEVEGDYENTSFTLIIGTPSGIWSGSNGFWGSTTVSDITDSLQASVQATGANIYPLLTFVGIPLGFLIAGFLVYLINRTLTPEKETVINSNLEIVPKKKRGRRKKYDLIYHSAEDLEFRRNYGRSKDI